LVREERDATEFESDDPVVEGRVDISLSRISERRSSKIEELKLETSGHAIDEEHTRNGKNTLVIPAWGLPDPIPGTVPDPPTEEPPDEQVFYHSMKS